LESVEVRGSRTIEGAGSRNRQGHDVTAAAGVPAP